MIAQMPTVAFDVAAAKERCTRFRKRVLEISQKVPALHVGGAFSCLEMVDVIYFSLLRRDASNGGPDTFLLSKGHGAWAQYVALEELGILSKEDLETYCTMEGRLGAHPDYGLPGIEASTGSLGHGLGMGLGMALADKVDRVDRVVYVVMSDGELQEGSVWESMLLAPSLGLKNLVACVDVNNLQSFAHTSEMYSNFFPVVDKTRAFGWETVEVNGHDSLAVYEALSSRSGDRPFMLVGRTVKGKGVSYMEDVPIWHYRSPSPEEYQQALAELDGAAR